MRRHRKLLVLLGSITLVVGSGLAAFAYWTTTGNGSGNATAASAGNYTVSATVADGIHPGGSVAVSGTIANNTSSDLNVANIDAGAPVVTFDGAHAACSASWFHFTGTVTNPGVLAAGTGSTGYTGTLSMDESGTSQDACQGATVTLHVVAS